MCKIMIKNLIITLITAIAFLACSEENNNNNYKKQSELPSTGNSINTKGKIINKFGTYY